jgi:hypothetical protein
LAGEICKTNDNIFNSSAGVKDFVGASTVSLRDAIERASVNNITSQTNYAIASADRDRDIQTTVERTGANGLHR